MWGSVAHFFRKHKPLLSIARSSTLSSFLHISGSPSGSTVSKNIPCHFTTICWKQSAMLAMTDSWTSLRLSALSRLHSIPRELWALPREVTESNFNELPCFEERKEKNHLRITFRLKTEWSFCKSIISSPRRLCSATVKTKVWILFWHGVWDRLQSSQ